MVFESNSAEPGGNPGKPRPLQCQKCPTLIKVKSTSYEFRKPSPQLAEVELLPNGRIRLTMLVTNRNSQTLTKKEARRLASALLAISK